MTSHIQCAQGSEEWFAFRLGAITASMFTECRTIVGGLTDQQLKYADLIKAGIAEKEAMLEAGYKSKPKAKGITDYLNGEKVGDYSPKAKEYAFKLAVERISGRLLDEDKFQTWQMARGNELEPKARMAYESKYGLLVQQTGLALTDDGAFGASVDGLIDNDGSLEIKCFLAPSKLAPIIIDGNAGEVQDQMQGSMWITGRKWCDFVLYCPALDCVDKDLTVIRYQRDDDYIQTLEADLMEFNKLVEYFIVKIKE